ncbi:MAG: hypothetical protein AAF843_21515 [Bacteroidota bacterium]
MKHLGSLFILIALVSIGCSDDTGSALEEFTGNELVYDLFQSSDFPISGSVTFQERIDGDVQVTVELEGTEGAIQHPVHLHFGDLSVPDAEIAFLLNDLKGSDGVSTTTVSKLSDESNFSFDTIGEFNGSIKVHLSATGADQDIILAAGNIGANQNVISGRRKVAICSSY